MGFGAMLTSSLVIDGTVKMVGNRLTSSGVGRGA
jgi:hypothetical protein